MKKRWLGLGGFTLAVVALLALWAFLPSGPKHHPEMESGSSNNQNGDAKFNHQFVNDGPLEPG